MFSLTNLPEKGIVRKMKLNYKWISSWEQCKTIQYCRYIECTGVRLLLEFMEYKCFITYKYYRKINFYPRYIPLHRLIQLKFLEHNGPFDCTNVSEIVTNYRYLFYNLMHNFLSIKFTSLFGCMLHMYGVNCERCRVF